MTLHVAELLLKSVTVHSTTVSAVITLPNGIDDCILLIPTLSVAAGVSGSNRSYASSWKSGGHVISGFSLSEITILDDEVHSADFITSKNDLIFLARWRRVKNRVSAKTTSESNLLILVVSC